MTTLIVIGSVVGVILIIFVLSAVGASRYKKAGPHQAFITTGRGGQRVCIGGGMFVWPVVQSLYVMDLQAQKVPVHREGIYSKNNVPITIDVTLVYKVKGDEGSVKLAAQALRRCSKSSMQGWEEAPPARFLRSCRVWQRVRLETSLAK